MKEILFSNTFTSSSDSDVQPALFSNDILMLQWMLNKELIAYQYGSSWECTCRRLRELARQGSVRDVVFPKDP